LVLKLFKFRKKVKKNQYTFGIMMAMGVKNTAYNVWGINAVPSVCAAQPCLASTLATALFWAFAR